LIVAVQMDNDQSLLWALRGVNLTNVLPWSATAFNEQVLPTDAPRLRLGSSGAASQTVIKVLAGQDDAVFAVTNAATDPASQLPPSVVLVHAFNSSTEPDMLWGSSGIAEYASGAALGGTYAADARMQANKVFVTGSTLTETAAATAENSYVNPCRAYLTLAAGIDPSTGVLASPEPFVVSFTGETGSQCVRLTTLPGCAPLHLATCLAAFADNGLMVIGDVNYHPGCPSQPVYLLDAMLAGRLYTLWGNCGATAVPLIDTCCDGYVRIDVKCAPTVLQVAGPVVVGCDDVDDASTALPGAMRYNPIEQRFEGYTGTEWLAFTMGPL